MTRPTVDELAELCGATLEGDGVQVISGMASLSEAGPTEISFLANERYAGDLAGTRAGAVLVQNDLRVERDDLTLLRCEHPGRAFTKVIEFFLPGRSRVASGVHPSAVLEEGVELSEGVAVGALCFVGRGSVLEAGVVLHPRVSIGPECRVGAQSVLHSGVVLYDRVQVGRSCVLHGGCVVGADGFGFEPVDGAWEKIPQCGTVVLEDHVELGANSTVDRGRFGPTRVLAGTKVDNLVHLAHNVTVGPHACLVAQVGVSGSTRIGQGVVLAGKVGVTGHIEIGDGAQVGGQSAVMKGLPAGGKYLGSPARPLAEELRLRAHIGRLPALARRVKELETRLASLETGRDDGTGNAKAEAGQEE